MGKVVGAMAALAALAAAGAALAQEPPAPQPLSLTNGSGLLVYCAVLVDARLYTNVRLKPAASWSHAFDPRREVALVCNRAKKPSYGPLALGSYSFVAVDGRVDLKAAEGV
ncbi:hypothetical protein [Phenylobacterium sp. J367]|uniref:hypothetical protein n=1 Tax=Phenylobacterium sp. J367 TaxID=2898435 RepID=UPI002151B229|nr:hypothetical protein [Phenylobacterium sp. J367]MCR5877081.1 hypothetical protein [Phenylobacterium sp. J367]